MKGKFKRTDTALRIIKASPSAIYQAFMDPKALVLWLPPEGMKGHIDVFEDQVGGTYRMTLTYVGSAHIAGKTSENIDVVQGIFVELVEDKRIVQRIEFESEDPAFSGAMIMTWNLVTVTDGTEVTVVCENVPVGIRQDEHEEGMGSTLENLARFLEAKGS
ncbi:SRPBCC domain-containing protein [Anaerosolibacter carboniphilus]|nr:SRPBCC domain-containing protein [Anaerosolibacter carboniphilus]